LGGSLCSEEFSEFKAVIENARLKAVLAWYL